MLCLSGFKLYSRWVPLNFRKKNNNQNVRYIEVWLITRNTCIAEPREGLGRGKAHKMSELEGGRELDEIV